MKYICFSTGSSPKRGTGGAFSFKYISFNGDGFRRSFGMINRIDQPMKTSFLNKDFVVDTNCWTVVLVHMDKYHMNLLWIGFLKKKYLN